MVKLTEVIKVWELLHIKDVGELGFCDLEEALESVCGVINDLSPCQPILGKEQG